MLSERQERVLRAHRDMDLLARTSPLPFVSGWGTAHSVDYEHLAPVLSEGPGGRWVFEYNFMADDEPLAEKVLAFHRRVDGDFPAGCEVFVGAGSSPLLSSMMVLLAQLGDRELHYVAPIYHAYYQLAKILGMRMCRVGTTLLEEGESGLCERLPDRKTALLITDPSWISGRSYSRPFFMGLRDWQRRTGSLVIVDGTFQYTKWERMEAELSSLLLPEQTFRLVCPTKSLCVHGVRCAYMILPSARVEEYGWYYCKLVAASSQFDIATARLMLNQLNSSRGNRDLVEVIRHQYASLLERGLVTDVVVEPSCTYYVFGRAGFDRSAVLTMNGGYFELDYPDDFVRINLLSSDLARLDGMSR